MAITRLPGGALTPKRPLDESFDRLDGRIVSAAYSSHLNLFYFFNESGTMYIYRFLLFLLLTEDFKHFVIVTYWLPKHEEPRF